MSRLTESMVESVSMVWDEGVFWLLVGVDQNSFASQHRDRFKYSCNWETVIILAHSSIQVKSKTAREFLAAWHSEKLAINRPREINHIYAPLKSVNKKAKIIHYLGTTNSPSPFTSLVWIIHFCIPLALLVFAILSPFCLHSIEATLTQPFPLFLMPLPCSNHTLPTILQ